MQLRARDLRAIADGLEALVKLNVVVNEFKTSEGIVCKVTRRVAHDQRDATEYFVVDVQSPMEGVSQQDR